MKINEAPPWIQEQKAPGNQANPASFEHWMESPAQDATGDEYYWQHQEQLQQSCLQFTAKPMLRPQNKLQDQNQREPVFNLSDHEEKQEQPKMQYCMNTTLQQINWDIKKTSNLIRALDQDLIEQSLKSYAISNNRLITDPRTKIQETKAQTDIENNNPLFKRAHLFLQGEHAELTLNTQDLNQAEQKELIQLIQDHLKKKGLILSRLIINGVPHD